MEKDIVIKGISVNLKMNRKFIEVEVPGEEILDSVDPNAEEFEALVKEKVIEYIKAC
jgi:hypothetical protein